MEKLRGGSPDRVLALLIDEAIADGASDVHIEPEEGRVRVRFRIDGLLSDRYELPLSMAQGLSVRSKVLGKMDVGESRLPQDGSYREEKGGISYDFRISILPSLYGETIVFRILSGKVDFIERNELGMLPAQEAMFRKALSRGQGLILTTGPTGSGKTSTLYAALKLLNQESVSIISIEDPVEYRLPGVTQLSVNERSGLTFAKGLRSLVRQDPDIVMIGEIRDKETAEIAIHAALTGHLVLSTLHTNNAASAPLRLMDMGVAPYLIAASLSLVMAQRLSGKVCPSCGRDFLLGEEEALSLGIPISYVGKSVRSGPGCPHCHGKGTKGRTGIFEMISIGRRERELIHHDFSLDKLGEALKDMGPTMGEAALAKMEAGLISPKACAEILAGEA